MTNGAKLQRFAEAYYLMAPFYRPCAPGDGMGSIELSPEQLADPLRLRREAMTYAYTFDAEDEACLFNLGCTDFVTNRASVFTVEAARMLGSGSGHELTARRLLLMALVELRRSTKGD